MARVLGTVGDDLLDAAAVTQDVAVVLEHAGTAGPLVQAVHVLRDQRESRDASRKLRQREMTGVRLGLANQFTAELVPVPDELRITLEGFGRGEILRTEIGPEAGQRVTKRGIPLSAEIPAPVSTQTCCALLSSAAA